LDGLSFRCRACGASDIAPILALGRTPLANALVDARDVNDPEETFPLNLVRCRHCTLVQIDETVPPEKLFRHYAYFSSFSDTMVAHAKRIADRLVRERQLASSNLVVEIASNDGYLLQHYVSAGVPVLGIDPAKNIAAVAERKGVRTESEFFGIDYAKRVVARGERADIIHANNVLAHVADLPGVVAGLAHLLAPDGLVVVEVPYVKDFIERCEFDTIYHEHLCYFSLTALDRLFAAHGLRIVHVEPLAIHGGTIRFFAAHQVMAPPYDRSAVDRLLDDERTWGVDRAEVYDTFARRVETWRRDTVTMLQRLKHSGHRLAAYGASAKGATLLNYTGLGRETLDFVVDRSTYKQGKLMPGVKLPIRPPSALVDDMPDYVLLLTWNFADEILAQQRPYSDGGGKFIVPVPKVVIR
jgi:predicted TPR repeat methyltransferase